MISSVSGEKFSFFIENFSNVVVEFLLLVFLIGSIFSYTISNSVNGLQILQFFLSF